MVKIVVNLVNVFKLLIAIGLWTPAEAKTNVQVRMYSDLITVVGKDDIEFCAQRNNSSKPSSSLRDHFQPLILSQYTFSTMTLQESCKNTEISSEEFDQFDWSCFTTGSNKSRDINWFFVDCSRLKIMSTKCLEKEKVKTIVENVCDESESMCNIVNQDGGRKEICSKTFEVHKLRIEASKKIMHDDTFFPSRLDVIAYICAVFILVSFIVSIVVPAEKCRPRFSYDDDSGLRVPLEIYELYGQHYKPSERRKAYKAYIQEQGSISYNKPYTSHLQNVAVLANYDPGPANRDRFSSVSTSVSEQFDPGFVRTISNSVSASISEQFNTGFVKSLDSDQNSSCFVNTLAIEDAPLDSENQNAVTKFNSHHFQNGSHHLKFPQRPSGVTIDSIHTGDCGMFSIVASNFGTHQVKSSENLLSVHQPGAARRSSLC